MVKLHQQDISWIMEITLITHVLLKTLKILYYF